MLVTLRELERKAPLVGGSAIGRPDERGGFGGVMENVEEGRATLDAIGGMRAWGFAGLSVTAGRQCAGVGWQWNR